jgi:2-oxoglutarate dehydrogenase E2 component (dihydrolipoamide succinyltransferase)
MSVEIKVPELPESVADALVASWYKKPGDVVHQDETLVDLETDKVILEVPALKSGVLKEIRFATGDTVTANQVLAIIDETAAADSPAVVKSSESRSDLATSPVKADHGHNDTPAISPSARRMIAERGIGINQVKGSGKGGRVLKQDVVDAVDNKPLPGASDMRDDSPAAPAATPPQAQTAARSVAEPQAKKPSANDSGQRIEKRVAMTRLRARIAERLVQAQSNAAILTTFNEVNMKPLMELRARYKDKFEKTFGVRLGYMSLFVKAVVEALKQSPVVNASVDGNDIVYHGYFDIGIAVSGPNGLVVPILRDADQMSVAEIEQAIADFASRAKNNTLNIEDLTGGTFTITNGGVFGSMLSTPILNPPQSAILGMHNIKERAMVVDGNVVALPMMYLALSYDHRLVDGREAVLFLVAVRDLLEDPARMILGL